MRFFLCLACLFYAGIAHACGENAPPMSRTVTIGEESGQIAGFRGDKVLGLQDKEIVLTFDDGPKPGVTDKILDLLKKECLKATFMLVGQQAQQYPDLVKRIAAEGHTVGYHSWSHKRFTEIPYGDMEYEVAMGVNAVDKALAPDYVASNFFRFPHLARNEPAEHIAHSHDLIVLETSFMVPDWLPTITAQEIHDQMMGQIRMGGENGVLILHDVFDHTAEALPLILASLKKEGYTIAHIVPEE